MTSRVPIFLVLLSIAWVGIPRSSCLTRADDWPHWMGPRHDGVWRESGILDTFPEGGPNVLWRAKIGQGHAGPAVVGDRLYVMDRVVGNRLVEGDKPQTPGPRSIPGSERVICMDVKSGDTVWTYEYDCPYQIAYPTGPRCTPAVDTEYVYTLGAMGKLICLRAATGDVVWEKNLTDDYDTKPPLWGFASHPYVDGNRLLVAVGGKGSGIVAFDKKTGAEIWRSVTTADIGYAPLVIFEHTDGRQLIYWHTESIDSLDPETGKRFWSVKFPEEKNESQVSVATPRIFGNRLLICEYYKGTVLLEIGSNPPSVTQLRRSYKTDPRNRSTLNTLMTTPLVKNGFAYSVANDTKDNGLFRCIEIESGEVKWTKPDWMGSKPVIFSTAFIVEHEDRNFIFNDAGELMIVKLSPDGFEEIDRAALIKPTGVTRGRDIVWCHPAFSNGRMYVRNDEEIICVDLRKTGASTQSEK